MIENIDDWEKFTKQQNIDDAKEIYDEGKEIFGKINTYKEIIAGGTPQGYIMQSALYQYCIIRAKKLGEFTDNSIITFLILLVVFLFMGCIKMFMMIRENKYFKD